MVGLYAAVGLLSTGLLIIILPPLPFVFSHFTTETEEKKHFLQIRRVRLFTSTRYAPLIKQQSTTPTAPSVGLLTGTLGLGTGLSIYFELAQLPPDYLFRYNGATFSNPPRTLTLNPSTTYIGTARHLPGIRRAF